MNGYQSWVVLLGVLTVIFATLNNWKPEVKGLL
jgi:hypothetical protein